MPSCKWFIYTIAFSKQKTLIHYAIADGVLNGMPGLSRLAELLDALVADLLAAAC